MKKQNVFMNIVTAAALLLTGCGNASGTAESSTPAADAPAVTEAASEQKKPASEADAPAADAGQEMKMVEWFTGHAGTREEQDKLHAYIL